MVVFTELREDKEATVMATAPRAIARRSDEEVLTVVLASKGGPFPFLQAAIDVVQRRSDMFRDPSVLRVVAEAQAKAEAERRKTAIEEARKATEEEPRTLREEVGRAAKVKRVRDPKPNAGNGLDLEKYSWTQQLPEVNITISVPQGTAVICEIMKNHLKVGFKGYSFIIDGELYQPVKVDECFWTIEDGDTLSILLTKQNQKKLWKSVIKGDPEVDLHNMKLSKFPDLGPETRQAIEKIIIEHRPGARSCNK